eukprot:1184976-Prorocentrum_minimum.AAC.1
MCVLRRRWRMDYGTKLQPNRLLCVNTHTTGRLIGVQQSRIPEVIGVFIGVFIQWKYRSFCAEMLQVRIAYASKINDRQCLSVSTPWCPYLKRTDKEAPVSFNL